MNPFISCYLEGKCTVLCRNILTMLFCWLVHNLLWGLGMRTVLYPLHQSIFTSRPLCQELFTSCLPSQSLLTSCLLRQSLLTSCLLLQDLLTSSLPSQSLLKSCLLCRSLLTSCLLLQDLLKSCQLSQSLLISCFMLPLPSCLNAIGSLVHCVMFWLVVQFMCLVSHWFVFVMWPSLFAISSHVIDFVSCHILML